METIHIVVKGIVQGVFFRANAKEKAIALDLTGWVKNCSNGTVEIVASGQALHLKEFIQWCHKGPKSARVSEVIFEAVETRDFEGFRIIRD